MRVQQGKSASAKGGASRVSAACLACRSRHIRCDATKPACKRCAEDGTECCYTKSRRGGLDKAALAARRQRLALEQSSTGQPKESHVVQNERPEILTDSNSTSQTSSQCNSHKPSSVFETVYSDLSDASSTNPSFELSGDLTADQFITTYYKCFHSFHPLVLPHRYLNLSWREGTKAKRFKPVLSCMRYIGCLYARSSESLRLRKDAADDIAQAKALTAQCPFLCQANLLYSISLFWSDDRAGSRRYMDDAISMAISLGMHRQEFAAMFGEGDAILAESWRRTWWQIYIVEWNYTAITRETNSRMRDVCAAVDLPCEEHEYEAGAIPTPASLADFDSREFASESPSFSLFAYLIGSTRGIAQILAGTPLNKETYPPVEVVEAADAMVDGWILLLPDSKRPVMSKTGEIDELLFQAYMGMHAGMVGLHRPYSALLFDPLEEISSCFTNAPGNEPLDENTNIHTMRCLASVEAQIRLMTLPKRPFCHSPFTICMITTGTIPFLSACKFLLTGTKLSIAREQIRLTIGCLRSLAHVWPQGEKTVKEIQAIAREVLGLGASAASMSCPQHSTAASGTSSRVSGSQRSPESMNGSRDSSTMEESLFPDSMDSLSSYWDIQNQQIDMNLWFTNYS